MAALIVFPFLYTLRIGITNNKSIDAFHLIFGKAMMKGVLARLERILERADAQENISTDVNLLKLHCVDIAKRETHGKHLEKTPRIRYAFANFCECNFPSFIWKDVGESIYL